MSGTTSIDSLPSDPTVSAGAPVQNVQMEIKEKHVSYDPNVKENDGNTRGMPSVVQQKQMNSIVSGIQQAAAAGATALPSRDIPMNQNRVQLDNQADPNYVPENNIPDYIQNHDTEQQFLEQAQRNVNKKDNLDVIYSELQIPILISLLFFMFNLPFFKKTLNTYAGFLFQKDGNYNLYGFAFSSTLFGILFYVLKAILNHFSTF
tara:strand:+ start:1846 stop:2460 length:615 start_codon:yes stop_codon:yes gene_type:complete